MNIKIKKLSNSSNAPQDLLLLADPSINFINEYLQNSTCYIALHNNETIGIIVLKKSGNSAEIMNLSVYTQFQRNGVGSKLIMYVIEKLQKSVDSIFISTGNSSYHQIRLYKKCGFKTYDVDKNYFIDNYSEQIYENGIQCKDKITFVYRNFNRVIFETDINVKTFNNKSKEYQLNRPTYPDDIFTFLSSITPENYSAWDCACGSGQVSKSLSKYFQDVKASDININQIRNSYKRKNITFSCQDSEKTDFEDNSFELVCVAQALPGFSINDFFKEVKRVLKPGGIFACWGYSFFKINPDIDIIIEKYLLEPIKSYWSEKNKILWNNYSEIKFPFSSIASPEINMFEYWNINELLNYIKMKYSISVQS